MANTITAEQEAGLPEYQKKWLDFGAATDECKFDEAFTAAKDIYKHIDRSEPFISFLTNNPFDGARFAGKFFGSQYSTDDEVPKEQVKAWVKNNKSKVLADGSYLLDPEYGIQMRGDSLDKLALAAIRYNSSKIKTLADVTKDTTRSHMLEQTYGYQEYWIGFYDFYQNVVSPEGLDVITGLTKLASVCGWWAPYPNGCIFQHKQLTSHRDAENRLHNTEGPCMSFRGTDKAVYAVHGVLVEKKIIDRAFTASDAEAESNAEVRRIMIELYGIEKFLKDTKATKIAEDNYGILWNKQLAGDEPIFMVQVKNSTPEPDGHFKDYFLRVDPNAYGGLKTARAAVASTWRNQDGSLIFAKPEDYMPAVET